MRSYEGLYHEFLACVDMTTGQMGTANRRLIVNVTDSTKVAKKGAVKSYKFAVEGRDRIKQTNVWLEIFAHCQPFHLLMGILFDQTDKYLEDWWQLNRYPVIEGTPFPRESKNKFVL